MSVKTGHVVFVEDKYYLLWQLELLIESLTSRSGIKECDIVVLYTDPSYHHKQVKWGQTPYLQGLMKVHDTVNFYPVQNWGRKNWYYRFNDNNSWVPKQYPGINKWLSLCEAANAGWLDKFEEIVLLEQDLWFSGDFPKLPPGNCVTANWLCDRYGAFEVTDKDDDMNTSGFDLDDIMKLCKVSSKNRKLWTSGAIVFKFVTSQLKRAKFLNAIVNYNQLLMTLGELALPQGARHETDMVAPSLAMAHCGMHCKTIDSLQWRSDVWTWNNKPPENVVVHYGWDFKAYPHLGSSFSKFDYNDKTPWDDPARLEDEYNSVKFDWIKKMYDDIFKLKEKIIERNCDRAVYVPVI
jgi:hypothetical protein